MYFWRLENLKSTMAARPLTDRESLPYLMVYTVSYAAALGLPTSAQNQWDTLNTILGTVVAALGTVYIYRRNGGRSGQHLLQRYFAIGWVVTIRWLVMLVPALVLLVIGERMLGYRSGETTWIQLVFYVLLGAALYWRIGHHVGDLANRALTPSGTQPDTGFHTEHAIAR